MIIEIEWQGFREKDLEVHLLGLNPGSVTY